MTVFFSLSGINLSLSGKFYNLSTLFNDFLTLPRDTKEFAVRRVFMTRNLSLIISNQMWAFLRVEKVKLRLDFFRLASRASGFEYRPRSGSFLTPPVTDAVFRYCFEMFKGLLSNNLCKVSFKNSSNFSKHFGHSDLEFSRPSWWGVVRPWSVAMSQ